MPVLTASWSCLAIYWTDILTLVDFFLAENYWFKLAIDISVDWYISWGTLKGIVSFIFWIASKMCKFTMKSMTIVWSGIYKNTAKIPSSSKYHQGTSILAVSSSRIRMIFLGRINRGIFARHRYLQNMHIDAEKNISLFWYEK